MTNIWSIRAFQLGDSVENVTKRWNEIDWEEINKNIEGGYGWNNIENKAWFISAWQQQLKKQIYRWKKACLTFISLELWNDRDKTDAR